MSANRLHLTDTAVRKALKDAQPGAPRVELTDDVRPFIRVRVSHDLAVFYWIGRNKTTRKVERHRLGEFPGMSVQNARDAAIDLKRDADKGKNIAKHRREARRVAVASGVATVADLTAAYIKRCEDDGKPLADSTKRSYNEQLPALLGDYFNRPVDALDEALLLKMIAARTKTTTAKTKHGRTVKRGNSGGALIAVKCLARLCRVNKLTDPTLGLRVDKRLPKIGDKGRGARLGTLEAQRLMAWLHAYARNEDNAPYKVRCARMLIVSIVTGWRISTVSRWRWEHIDLARKTTQLPGNKKDYKQTLPLWPLLADMLTPIAKERGPVFGPWVPSFVSEMPAQVTPQDGRRALTVVLLQAVKGDKTSLVVKLLMTHRDDVTVQHYLRNTPTDDQLRLLRPVVNKVSAFYAAKIGDKATVKALEVHAAKRRAAVKADRKERGAVMWADYAARRKARLAA